MGSLGRYTSTPAHSSLEKAAKIAVSWQREFCRDRVDESLRFARTLSRADRTDRSNASPFCRVARNHRNNLVDAIDPVPPNCRISHANRLLLHVGCGYVRHVSTLCAPKFRLERTTVSIRYRLLLLQSSQGMFHHFPIRLALTCEHSRAQLRG